MIPRGPIPRGAMWVESPWYGRLEICGLPGAAPCPWGTECWDGASAGWFVTETLRPLTAAAARMLDRAPGDRVWDAARKRAWENEPIANGPPLAWEDV